MVSETPYHKYPGVGYNRYFGIPAQQVRIGKNTIAIRIYAPTLSPAIAVAPNVFKAGPTSLAGEWLAKAEYELPALSPSVLATVPAAPARPPAMMAGGIFNGVVHPLIPYALSGVIWYQGESNTGRAFEYRNSFPLLIKDWRQQWGQEDLPFYFCQLAGYGPKRTTPAESEWAELREAQSLAAPFAEHGRGRPDRPGRIGRYPSSQQAGRWRAARAPYVGKVAWQEGRLQRSGL